MTLAYCLEDFLHAMVQKTDTWQAHRQLVETYTSTVTRDYIIQNILFLRDRYFYQAVLFFNNNVKSVDTKTEFWKANIFILKCRSICWLFIKGMDYSHNHNVLLRRLVFCANGRFLFSDLSLWGEEFKNIILKMSYNSHWEIGHTYCAQN